MASCFQALAQFLPAIAGQTDKGRAGITAIGFSEQGSYSSGLAVSISANNDTVRIPQSISS